MIKIEFGSYGKSKTVNWHGPPPRVGDQIHLAEMKSFPEWEDFTGRVSAVVYFSDTFVRVMVSR